ncbi:MAG: PD-(D/E)XK nuclease domain-containing protein [Clostridiales bacterium]|nr:PD-(D/E)XK nuclease domain-containing protein [Clostridiales bacterium]
MAEFCNALKAGDASEVERLFLQFMSKTISTRDTAVRKEFKENFPSAKAISKGLKKPDPRACFYHGILLGILGFKSDWAVDSNRESGEGYYDIAIEIEDEAIGIIIEVKYAENEDFDAACQEAMQQIEEHDYTAELKKDDMQTILKYGIACCRKKCRVVVEKENG